MKKIRFVIGTRKSQNDFFIKTATGKSIPLVSLPFVELRLFPGGNIGLPAVYNIALEESINDPATLIFMHDDIHLLDYFYAEKIFEGLNKFDVIGIAGNKRRMAKQPSWAFIDDKFTWDDKENLSGIVGHGSSFPPSNLSIYGPSCQEVKLLDGLMLAVHSEKLIRHQIRFDEEFDFHFYDLDFCRQIEKNNLTMGTWPISVIHESGGDYGNISWKRGYEKYLKKWVS